MSEERYIEILLKSLISFKTLKEIIYMGLIVAIAILGVTWLGLNY